MKAPSTGLLSFALVALAGGVLAALGSPDSRVAPPPRARPVAPAPGVSAGGFALTSTAIELPTDAERLPAGPQADLVNARCTACHSAGMMLNQPALSADQWQATVTKMREVYRAPIDDGEVPAIVAYLAGLSAKVPGAAR